MPITYARSSSTSQTRAQVATILLVGEGDPLADAIHAALRRRGCWVRVTDAPSAARMVTYFAPDRVLLVGDAAEQGGREWLHRLSAIPAMQQVPIAVLGGDEETEATAREAGAARVIDRTASADAIATQIMQLGDVGETHSPSATDDVEKSLERFIDLLSQRLQGAVLCVQPSKPSAEQADITRIVLEAGEPLQQGVRTVVEALDARSTDVPLRYDLQDTESGRLHRLQLAEAEGAASASLWAGLRVLVVGDDAKLTESLAGTLREQQAVVAVTRTDTQSLERLHSLDPSVILVDAARADRDAVAVLRKLRNDLRLRWASVLIGDWKEWQSRGSRAQRVQRLAGLVAPLLEVDHWLRRQVRREARFEARLEDVGPSRLLRALAAAQATLEVTVRSKRATIELELSRRKLTRVRAETGMPHVTREGVDALAVLLALASGQVEVRRREEGPAGTLSLSIDDGLRAAEAQPLPLQASWPPSSLVQVAPEGERIAPSHPHQPSDKTRPSHAAGRDEPQSTPSMPAASLEPPRSPSKPPTSRPRKSTPAGVTRGGEARPSAPPPARVRSLFSEGVSVRSQPRSTPPDAQHQAASAAGKEAASAQQPGSEAGARLRPIRGVLGLEAEAAGATQPDVQEPPTLSMPAVQDNPQDDERPTRSMAAVEPEEQEAARAAGPEADKRPSSERKAVMAPPPPAAASRPKMPAAKAKEASPDKSPPVEPAAKEPPPPPPPAGASRQKLPAAKLDEEPPPAAARAKAPPPPPPAGASRPELAAATPEKPEATRPSQEEPSHRSSRTSAQPPDKSRPSHRGGRGTSQSTPPVSEAGGSEPPPAAEPSAPVEPPPAVEPPAAAPPVRPKRTLLGVPPQVTQPAGEAPENASPAKVAPPAASEASEPRNEEAAAPPLLKPAVPPPVEPAGDVQPERADPRPRDPVSMSETLPVAQDANEVAALPPEGEQSQPSSSKRKLIVGAAAAVLLVGGGFAVWASLPHPGPSATSAPPDTKHAEPAPPAAPAVPGAEDEPSGEAAGATKKPAGEPAAQEEPEAQPSTTQEPATAKAEAEPAAADPPGAGEALDDEELRRIVIHANHLQRSGREDEAKEIYLQVLEQDPNEHHAKAGLAELYIDRDKGEEALVLTKDIVDKRSRRTRYRVLHGDALALTGDRAAAREQWEIALKIEPGYKPALRRLGRQAQPAENDESQTAPAAEPPQPAGTADEASATE